MLTKVCQTSTTAPQTLCGQKSRGAAQAHLPARLQGLWGLRLFAATLLALAACASNDLEIANLSVDPSNQEGRLKNYTYKEIFKDGRCVRKDYPNFTPKHSIDLFIGKCFASCNDGYFYNKSRCYKDRKVVKISDRNNGHCGGGNNVKCSDFYAKKICCSCGKGEKIVKTQNNGRNSISGFFCSKVNYGIKGIGSYSRCNVDRYRCKDFSHTNCKYNEKLQKCTWKGGLITELPAGTSYLCEGQKDTEDNIHCYDIKTLYNKPTNPNFLKPIQADKRESKICPPNTPVFYQKKCREQCYGDTDDLHDGLCYQRRSPASSTDCTGKATFSFGGKSLCCPAGKLFKNGNCYVNIYKLTAQRDLKPFCHTFNNSNCGRTGKSSHCARRNDKCVWNLPEYGYPSCRIEGQAVMCRPTETP